MSRATVLAAGAVTLLAVVGCTSLTGGRSLEDLFVFQPQTAPHGNWVHGRGVEDARFESADGCQLHGWFVAADRPRAVVLYAHGNAENVSDLTSVLRLYRDRLNVSVLVFDYRGYGRSAGTPSEDGVFADARAARRWLAARANVPEGDIVLAGRSLGGGVAVDLAARDGARGLILESTFSSLPDTAASHLPLLPVRSLMRTRFDSVAKIPNYHGPLLQVHGDADRIVPPALGRKLFDAANEPKWFVSVPGAGHNDPPSRAVVEALDRFFDTLPTAPRTDPAPSIISRGEASPTPP
jgi:fermentation-respiration switch protein FrsA (DUF1100 family)